MIKQFIKLYIDKYTKIKNKILENININDFTFVYNIPKIRTIVRSVTLNAAFNVIYKNIVYLYVIMNNKINIFNSYYSITKEKLTSLATRINNIYNYIKQKSTITTQLQILDVLTLHNVMKISNNYMLSLNDSFYIKKEDVDSISFSVSPYVSNIVKSNIDDATDILFSFSPLNSYVEYSPITEIPLITQIDNNLVNGVKIECILKFKKPININAIHIKLPYDNIILYKISYSLDTKYNTNDINTIIHYEYFNLFNMPFKCTDIRFIFIIPYGAICSSSITDTAEIINDIIDKIKFTMFDEKQLASYLDEKLTALKSTEYIYKYQFGISKLSLINSNGYYNIGRIEYQKLKMYGNIIGFNLVVEQTTDSTSIINYYLKIDNNTYMIAPSIINNQYINEYDVEITSDNQYECINGIIDNNKITNISRFVSPYLFKKEKIFTYVCDSLYYTFNIPIYDIKTVYIDDMIFNRVYAFSDLTTSSAPSFMFMNNTILTNRIYPNKYLNIVAYTYPLNIRLIAELITRNPYTTPIIKNAAISYIYNNRKSNITIKYSNLKSNEGY